VRYTNEHDRQAARQRTYRDSKRRRAELKRTLQKAKRICRSPYCLGEALESGYCGRHEELLEDAS
jgi:hypothetical protein